MPALDHGFVDFDDKALVTENPEVLRGLSAEGFRYAFSTPVLSNYHPLTMLSHMLDVELFGLNARGHHLMSLLFHAASTLLLFVWLLSWSRSVVRSGLAAALFAVHPLRVESVVWVAERKDVLSVFFGMMCLIAYGRYTERPGAARYWPVAVTLLLSLLAKPTLVTMPLVLLLLDLWPLRRLPIGEGTWNSRQLLRLSVEKLPLVGIAIGISLATLWAQGQAIEAVSHRPLALRLGNALVSPVTYLGKTIWPTKLAVLYPFPEHLEPTTVFGAAFLLLVLSALAVAVVRQAPFWFVGWAWFLVTLLPMSGVVPTGGHAYADRFTYFPSIGLALAVVWGTHSLVSRRPRVEKILVVAATVIAGLGIGLCRHQAQYWANNATLFGHALDVTERNGLAHVNLAKALLAQGKVGEAMTHYRRATEIDPRQPVALAGLGHALRMARQPAQAAPWLKAARDLDPANPVVHYELAMALEEAGGLGEAAVELEVLVELEPSYAPGHYGLASILERLQRPEEALVHYRRALALAPELPGLVSSSSRLLLAAGEDELLMQSLEEALRRRPDDRSLLSLGRQLRARISERDEGGAVTP